MVPVIRGRFATLSHPPSSQTPERRSSRYGARRCGGCATPAPNNLESGPACSAALQAFIEPPSPGRPLPPVAIVLADGSSTRSDATDVDFDCAPLHLITDATLTELGGHHTDGAVDRRRFRPISSSPARDQQRDA